MELFHFHGSDLVVGPTGDLQTVDGWERGVQRVLRRLLTNDGDYIWHADYGAGMPRRVGSTIDRFDVESLVRSQIFLEESVAKDPEPQITVTRILNGMAVRIVYFDTGTRQEQTLSFEVS